MHFKILVSMIATLTTTTPEACVYADAFMVSNVRQMGADSYELELLAQNSNVFIVEVEDADWLVGDIASCIMSDMGTESVTDDEIITLKYSGWTEEINSWIR